MDQTVKSTKNKIKIKTKIMRTNKNQSLFIMKQQDYILKTNKMM